MRWVAMVLLLVLVAPAGAAAAPGLAGNTSLDAPGSAWAPVDVPVDTRVTLFEKGKLTLGARLDAAGPLRVLYLAREPLDAASPGLFGMLGPFGGPLFVFPVGDLEMESNQQGDTAWVTLPAGRYRFYAAGGAGPVSASLSIPDAPGATSLIAAERLDTRSSGLERRDGLPVTNAAVLGGVNELSSSGLVAFEMFEESVAGLAHRVESCVYGPDSDPEDDAAFGPGCPGGGESFEFIATLSSGVGIGGASFGVAPGRWGLGGNMQAAAVPPDIDGGGLWMPYAGTALPQPPQPPAPAPAPAAGTPTSRRALPALVISTARAHRSGRIEARIDCRAPMPCRGRLAASSHGRRLGAKRWYAAAGRSTIVRMRAPLRRIRRIALTATARGGMATTRSLRVR